MKKMKQSFKFLYIGTLVLFSVYILFLSDNNVKRHYELSKQIRDTENNLNKINNYIVTDHHLDELFSNSFAREQHARENMNLSKKEEDVFIFVYE